MSSPRDFIKQNDHKTVNVDGVPLTIKRLTVGDSFAMQKKLAALETDKADSAESVAIMLSTCVVDDGWTNVAEVEKAVNDWEPSTITTIVNEILSFNGLQSVEEVVAAGEKKVRES